MTALGIFLTIVISLGSWVYGIQGACRYFDSKGLQPNIIRLFIVFCPIWNLYFTYKWMKENKEQVKELLNQIAEQFKIGE